MTEHLPIIIPALIAVVGGAATVGYVHHTIQQNEKRIGNVEDSMVTAEQLADTVSRIRVVESKVDRIAGYCRWTLANQGLSLSEIERIFRNGSG